MNGQWILEDDAHVVIEEATLVHTGLLLLVAVFFELLVVLLRAAVVLSCDHLL